MENTIDFTNIVKDIETHKIVLPDFQREFVWRDESMQKQIVASVFAKMPIGSILLLKSDPTEFASKNIGSKVKTNSADLANEVEYLLDGQQRITVLANVFSNIIFEQTAKFSDLNSPTLKRRFFLKIPHWKSVYNEEGYDSNILGIKNFSSPQDPYGEVDFLTNDILPYIEVKSFKKDDDAPFNPMHGFDSDLDNYCIAKNNEYLVPLFIFIPTQKNKQKVSSRMSNIISGIGGRIYSEIIDYFTEQQCSNNIEKQYALLNDLLEQDSDNMHKIKACIKSEQKEEASRLLKEELKEKETYWARQLEEYINSCLNKMLLNKIIVGAEKRARAIDIYENLNRGGVSLSTFDLIMARVAIKSTRNFYQRVVDNINSSRKYNVNLLPQKVKNVYKVRYENCAYNASVNTNCYSESDNQIVKTYIDAFLNVLSLYCYNKSYDCKIYNSDLLKRDKILQIPPEEIDTNCEKICTSLDRAMFFFQSRCGIRKISEINNNLMLILVATIFTKDEYYEDKSVHDKLEAWYWACIFSGEFDKDQNTRLISNLKSFLSLLSGNGTDEWIQKLNEDVLNANNYSDEKLLLMEKTAEDRYPKQILRSYIAQYFLAKTYPGMFAINVTVSVFSDSSETLELHHIIPLGSVNDISQSTSKLRNNKEHICNSPLNFVYITKDDNLKISSKSLNDYAQMITVNAKSALRIDAYNGVNSASKDEDIENILKTRFIFLKGDIQNHVKGLLG